jgi:hypothetical protein
MKHRVQFSPPCDRNLSASDRSLAVGLLSKSSISSPTFLFSFSRIDGIDNSDCNKQSFDYLSSYTSHNIPPYQWFPKLYYHIYLHMLYLMMLAVA